jgi:hypothetical protein
VRQARFSENSTKSIVVDEIDVASERVLCCGLVQKFEQ